MALFWTLLILLGVGTAAALAGLVTFAQDGRRLGALIATAIGAATAVFSGGMLALQQGHQGVLLGPAIAVLIVLVLGNILGYPALTLFLLFSGFTVLRRESRTLGNGLALLAGLTLLVLPATVQMLEPSGTVKDDVGYMVRYGVHLAVVLLVGYLAFCFAAFLAASLLYRWRRMKTTPEAVIVLGSGLVKGNVPPLLAGRLDRALQAQRSFNAPPVMIPSGGQGPDEPLPEGHAMRDYLISRGVDPKLVVAEAEARNTQENLELSRALLTSPDAPVLVVTSSYHVYRAALLTRRLGMRAHVMGSKTVWYFLPSALLREFIGVMRDNLRIHIAAVVAILVFAAVITTILVPAMVPPPPS